MNYCPPSRQATLEKVCNPGRLPPQEVEPSVEPDLLLDVLAELLDRPLGAGGHISDRQVLGNDQAMFINALGRGLMNAILAPVSDPCGDAWQVFYATFWPALIACLAAPWTTAVKRSHRKSLFWSRSYRIISCGGAPLAILKQYTE